MIMRSKRGHEKRYAHASVVCMDVFSCTMDEPRTTAEPGTEICIGYGHHAQIVGQNARISIWHNNCMLTSSQQLQVTCRFDRPAFFPNILTFCYVHDVAKLI